MAALFLKRLTLQTVKSENSCVRCFGKHIVQKTAPAQSFPIASAPRLSFLIHAEAFSTVEDTQNEGKKKKKSQTAFGNIGRKISQRIIHLFDEKGNDMGNMHRADVIRLMDERDLRLVQRNASTEPAEYQLMTGMQILQERQRLREMKKASPKTVLAPCFKPGPTLTKELTFSSNIGQHDLDTKTKQIQQWIKKERQVRITIKKGKNVDVSENKMEEIFHQILQTMPGMATFLSRPQAVQGGKALMCVLRPLSKNEEKAYGETQKTQKRDTLNQDQGNDKESNVLHQ
nr:translation initiation factor IF-3, mitochondrial isoform X1 [Macaca nemestrina]XP_024651292.1 translation initiation factor IF-3, mitochondrial isoform X1 [Macaca nemestrina]XP_024651293.1 translation initiation factor IF-3, mitochondrial isoform X1 [Macaca nemestrina]XP_024651294.1 translation initiation factor IF-3, mitochondrial isoform X1 [Macaca nemestrina]XP_024651295.1 translation initiation factor IF-3, mitochondrial isoform X1 [Macaca nemestrina]XP_024651296.1 translation initiati